MKSAIVRRRQHRHPHRAAARPGPSSHQEETPTTSKSEINSTRYPRTVLTEEGEHPLETRPWAISWIDGLLRNDGERPSKWEQPHVALAKWRRQFLGVALIEV